MKALKIGLTCLVLSACQMTPEQSESEDSSNNDLVTVSSKEQQEHQLAAIPDPYHKDSGNEVPEPKTLAPSDYADVWIRIQQQLSITVPTDDKRLKSQLKWLEKHPDYMRRVSLRAEPYLHFMVEEIERRGMPLELALLPIVESAFQPFAYSHGRAAGMWQIIPSTGERFGLEQNWWYDGRRDVYASTHAALDYLTYLHGFFDGDWLLALAAYNSGEGRVRNAVRANKKKGLDTDFWSLSLPKETEAYVPKLLALSHLLQEKKQYQLDIPPIANQAHFSKIEIGGQIDLALAADLAGIPLDELHKLNPAFNRWATAPDGPYYLLIPTQKTEQFELGLAALPQQERMQWARYKVKAGDSLSVIAKRYNTTSKQIRELNKLSSNTIRIDQALLVPTSSRSQSDYTLSKSQRLASTQSRSRGNHKYAYTVKSGDSLWSISKQHKVKHRNLAKWNGIAPGDPIRPGQKLVIWQQEKASSDTIQSITYKVRNGDSLYLIAQKFSVSVQDLLKWNSLNKSHYLQPGQKLKLYVDVTEVSA